MACEGRQERQPSILSTLGDGEETHLLDQVDGKDEDERSDDADGQQTDDARSSDEDAKAGGGEEEARNASRPADLVEEDLWMGHRVIDESEKS